MRDLVRRRHGNSEMGDFYLAMRRRRDDAIDHARTGCRLDPLSPFTHVLAVFPKPGIAVLRTLAYRHAGIRRIGVSVGWRVLPASTRRSGVLWRDGDSGRWYGHQRGTNPVRAPEFAVPHFA